MEKRTRVRFAPSPTGPLHMGGVRTALYNYLYAKQHGGDFIIRIEDTDSHRFVPGAEKYIIEALNWCGIIPDEGIDADGNVVETPSEKHPHAPYRQSQRRGIYRKYAEELVEKGYAYYAFDTAEELAAKRAEMEAEKQTFIYNHITRKSLRNSLSMPESEWRPLLETHTDWTIRFRMPENRTVKMDDLIRGHIEVNTDTLDDKVLWKRADELPTYHLANIVDDHLMEITEVIRGEEWLPSLPLHYLLYEAFGWQDSMPRFAHLSLLLKPDGKGKLSKRDGDRLGFPVFPLEWHDPKSGDVASGYRESGYLPQAVINFLALLGWNPGNDQEILSMDELISLFSFEHCSKSGAKFDFEKGKWFNHEYIMAKPDAELAELFKPVLEKNGVDVSLFSDEYIAKVVGLVKNRVSLLGELWANARFFFVPPTEYAEKDIKKRWKPEMPQIMRELIEVLKQVPDFSSKPCEEVVLAWIAEKGYHLGNVMNAFRLTVVGECKGPHMFDITELIGRDETVARVSRGIENIRLADA